MQPRRAVAVLAVVTAVASAAALAARPDDARAGGSTIRDTRRTDGVVFETKLLVDYLGAPIDELRLYTFDSDTGAWAYAPFQVDERLERDRYVIREDDLIDENDELVALAVDLGGRAPAEAWPADADDTDVRYDLRVTDPLDPAAEGWLHVFRSTKVAQEVPTLITYDDASGELKGTDYRLVQARTFPGLETLELFGDGVDVLDRTKLRASIYAEVAPMLGPIPLPTVVFKADYTEESDEVQQGAEDAGFNFRPVRRGPVRLVLEADGAGFAYPGQVQVFAAFGRLDVPEIPPEIKNWIKKLDLEARVTIDFSDQALTGLYSDANRPRGVPVDGRPDSVPEKPISEWRQVDTPHGTVILVSGRPAALRTLGAFYNDSGRDRPPGTGDNKAYGENGVFTEDMDSLDRITDFLGWIVALPPGTPIVGELVAQQLRNPLVVEAIRVQRAYLATPTATDPPTATPAPTDTPAPTAAASATPAPTDPATAIPPTATPAVRAAYLPWTYRQYCTVAAVPLDVVLALDTSSSMREAIGAGGATKIEAAQAAARTFAELLRLPPDRAAVVGFDAAARDATGGLVADLATLHAAIDGLTTRVGTRIDLGLDLAGGILTTGARPGANRVIVLLSDGGGDDRALAVADSLRAAGVRVITIGLGADVDAGLLMAVATTPADYHFAPDAAALADIYTGIAEELVTCQ